MKRFILYILASFFIFTNLSADAAVKMAKKEYKTASVDGFNICSTLTYPKIKGQREYKTVILLHSLGYNSKWWGDLPDLFLNDGYAVLQIDLRGHGKSIYDNHLQKISWKDLKKTAYQKYPNDVAAVVKAINDDNPKRIFFNDYAIIGSDIGASTAVLSGHLLDVEPNAIVMLSPNTNIKGLYIPEKIAQYEKTGFLVIYSQNDNTSKKSSSYLRRFAQDIYIEYLSESNSYGMLILKNDNTIEKVISEWVIQYFKN